MFLCAQQVNMDGSGSTCFRGCFFLFLPHLLCLLIRVKAHVITLSSLSEYQIFVTGSHECRF